VMGWGVDAMLWTAERVASLPGAILRMPAMPTAAFLLMVAGGLWLALWQTRWRLVGAALAVAGLALAPTLRLPDDGRIRMETVAQARGQRPWSSTQPSAHITPAAAKPATARGPPANDTGSGEPDTPDPEPPDSPQ